MDRETKRVYNHTYNVTHRKEIAAQKRVYRDAHREHTNTRQRAYNAVHRKEMKAGYRARRDWEAPEAKAARLARRRELYAQRDRPLRTNMAGGVDWRGGNFKQIIAAEHRIVERAITEGTLTDKSPYYGWSVALYREHFQLDTDHPLNDDSLYSMADMDLHINLAMKGA